MDYKIRKQICLVTSEESFRNNFGAALQGYALFYTLNQKFGDCKVLHYDSLSSDSQIMKIKKDFFLKRLMRIPTVLSRKFYMEKNKLKLEIRNQKFNDFQKNILFVDSNRYNLKNIKELNKTFDYMVCGSDQIWNPIYKNYHNDPIYFLNFGDERAIRIAYAPSIGISDYPESCKDEFKKFLEDFNFISIREKTGQKIIEEAINQKVPVVPDPTFLLSKQEWLNVSSKIKIDYDYILLYRFMESDEIDVFVQKISKETGWKVITIPMYYNKKNKNYQLKIDTGPAEFINLVKNAKLVCTESFHATVFSIIFNTPFVSFERKELKKTKDSRIANILQLFELEHRLYQKSYLNNYNFLLDTEDLKNTDGMIEDYKKIGLNYLDKAFEN